jgi:predicted ATP-grasp superfamily ATP-dependent carboligase
VKKPKVLILDGAQRSALAATRSLGRRGVPVVVGGEHEQTLSGCSRYCAERLAYPSPARDGEGFVRTILSEIRRREIEVLLPMTEITTSLVLQHMDEFHSVRVPFASFELFERLADKWTVMELAQDLGVPIPPTYFIRGGNDLRDVLGAAEFPVVLKPRRSRIRCEGRWIETSVKYANSPQELLEIANTHHCFSHHPFLVQKLIRGQGYGVFALYAQGRPAVFFAHRRLRERPPTGGVSVLSESAEMNPQALRGARAILDDAGWHGVAMVEFKISTDGTPYLMEVNPRFWGSLQLAVDAGVDFSWLAYQLALGELPRGVETYQIGARERWLLGDVAHLYRLFFPNGNRLHLSRREKLHSLRGFLDFFDRNTRYEINRWDDLKPFFLEMKSALTRQ